jgi:integrase
MGKDLKGKELSKGIRQKPNGVYEARAQVNGITINKSGTNLNQVKKDFEKAKEKAKNHPNTKKSEYTLNEWYEEWFTTYKVPNLALSSIQPMKTRYKGIFSNGSGKKKLADIKSIDLQRDINSSRESGKSIKGIQDAVGQLSKCFESAKSNKLVEVNPCIDLIIKKNKDRDGNRPTERRFLSPDEQKLFLMEAANSWYKEMLYIMLLTGLRVGEIGGLKWKDVDFENKCIHVNQSLSCQYYKGIKTIELTSLKTDNSYRTIPFMGEAEEMFLSQKKKQDKLREDLGDRWRGKDEFSDLVFTTSMGSPVIRMIAEKEVNNVVKQVNLNEALQATKENREPVYFESAYPHAMRHTFCSNCFRFGMEPKTVQGLMGHRYYSTTIDIYTHVMGTDYSREAEKYQKLVPSTKSSFPKEVNKNVVYLESRKIRTNVD